MSERMPGDDERLPISQPKPIEHDDVTPVDLKLPEMAAEPLGEKPEQKEQVGFKSPEEAFAKQEATMFPAYKPAEQTGFKSPEEAFLKQEATLYPAARERKPGDVMQFSAEQVAEVRATARAAAAKREAAKKLPKPDQLPSPDILDTLPPPPKPPARKKFWEFWK